jgi:hypothetical protein
MVKLIQYLFSHMAEGGVSKVVSQGDGLCQIFVEMQRLVMVRAIWATSRVWVNRVR